VDVDIESGDDPAKHWIVVSSVGNQQRIGRRTVDRGFTIQGLKSRHRKKAEQMRPGDKIVFYVTGRKAFAGIATVTSPFLEDSEPIWVSGNAKKAGDPDPERVRIEPDLALSDDAFVPAEGIARKMAYASKWLAEHWTLAFQGNVHLIPEGDYRLIHAAIASAG